MNKLLKCVLILAAVSVALIVNGYSQTSTQPQGSGVLSGHEKKNEDAIKGSTHVVVATFSVLGYPGPGADGEANYDQAEIAVVTALKGTLSGQLKAHYIVYDMPGKDQESLPALGTQYIMFIQQLGPTEYEIKKLLPATDDNIAKVKQLISQVTK
jgi:hypothetical protein